MKKKEKTVFEYWSDDGHVFDKEEACKRYEDSIKAMDKVEKFPNKYVGHLSEACYYIFDMEPEFWYRISSDEELSLFMLAYPGNELSRVKLKEKCKNKYPTWIGIHAESLSFNKTEYLYIDYKEYCAYVDDIYRNIHNIE